MAERRKTVSRVMFNRPENAMVQKWCDLAARYGGTFSVHQAFTEAQWWTTYTIEWPDEMLIPADASTATGERDD